MFIVILTLLAAPATSELSWVDDRPAPRAESIEPLPTRLPLDSRHRASELAELTR